MSDLTRRVLDDELAWGALDPGHHPEGQAAVYRLANAAPVLARQVEAVESLADELDEAANIEVRTISGEVLDAEYGEGLRYAASRIRHALRDAHGEARP